jgi:hypothetical protein
MRTTQGLDGCCAADVPDIECPVPSSAMDAACLLTSFNGATTLNFGSQFADTTGRRVERNASRGGASGICEPRTKVVAQREAPRVFAGR